jgi:hypothetical protein
LKWDSHPRILLVTPGPGTRFRTQDFAGSSIAIEVGAADLIPGLTG